MKAIILAGGLGTRLAEETEIRPKPMVHIGEQPILWHIMKHLGQHGIREFIVALGYKGEVIKRYWLDYRLLHGSLSIDVASGQVEWGAPPAENWMVHLVDTGYETQTGGRVRRLRPWLDEEPFLVTYGDGVCNLQLDRLLACHRSMGRIATVTAVRPPARFGGITVDGGLVADFTEKPQIGEGWINGGYMIFEPGIFEYLHSDSTILELETLEHLAAIGELAAYQHEDFWQCMDTLRDKRALTALWESGRAPWKVWDE